MGEVEDRKECRLVEVLTFLVRYLVSHCNRCRPDSLCRRCRFRLSFVDLGAAATRGIQTRRREGRI